MKINVGSKNKTKIKSVKEAVALYPKLFPNPEIIAVDVNVEVFGHPKNLQEVVDGAIKRAKEAFKDCDYSFGLEGGMMEVPDTKTGYMETAACAVYDGKNISLGLSPSFEWPKEVTKLIREGNVDASQVFKQLNLTSHEKIGMAEGGVGMLTENRMIREDFTKYGIIMALIQLEKPELY